MERLISDQQMAELSRLNYKMSRWLAYCEECRTQSKENKKKNLPSVEIDISKDLTTGEYYRMSELSSLFFGRTEPYSRPYEYKLKEFMDGNRD